MKRTFFPRTWNPFNLLRARKSRRGKSARKTAVPKLEHLENRLAPANADVLSYHYDSFVSGQTLQEQILTPANVNATNFGTLFNVPIDGQAYAQPLYKTNVMIGGVAHNVAFIATEHDSVYAFDADTGAQLWHNSYIDPANGITTIPFAEISTPDLFPEIGITGTGVIDPSGTGTLYEVVRTKEVGRGDGRVHYVQKLHALDLATGAEKFGGPYTIGDTSVATPGAVPVFANENTAIMVPGVGSESSGGANSMVPFSAEKQNVRMSLALQGNIVYVAWASDADFRPYHGWVVGFDKTTLQPVKVLNTSPNTDGVSIWESGGGLSFDAQGNMYFATGNGFQLTGGFSPFDPAHGNYSESVLKVDTTPNWSPANPGNMMTVVDYFTPNNWASLDSQDADLGSGGVILLPDFVGSDAHRHLMVETGKQGRIYLIDRDNLGQNVPAGQADQVVQVITAGQAGVWGNPAFYQTGPDSGIIYYHGSNDVLKGYRITNGHMDDVSADILRSTFNSIFPGTQPTVSADGITNPTSPPVNGIVWELQVDNAIGRIQGASDNTTAGPATLRAFIANPSGTTFTEIYDTSMTGQRDFITGSVKFTVPIVTNGHVLVAGADHFAVLGLFPTETAAPAAPSGLTATLQQTPQGPRFVLNWTNPSPNPGSDPTGIKILRSTDGVTFTQINTVSRNLNTFTDTGPFVIGQQYMYEVVATNQVGDSAASNSVSVVVPIPAPVLTLTGTGASEVGLSWTALANDRFDIERSTDNGQTFQVVGTVPTSQFAFVNTGLAPGLYVYRIHAFNNNPTADAISNVVGVWVGPTIDHGSGFSNLTNDLTTNGSAFIATNLVELTNSPGQAGSVFSNNRFTVANFTSTFDVRLHEGTQPDYADGFAFVLQPNGPTALGSTAAGIGYQGIGHSVALVFNTFQHTGEPSTTSVGLAINGAAAGNLVDTTPSGLLLNSQDEKQIDLTYDGTTLTVRITDVLQPQLVFNASFAVNIPQVLGSDTAYVGLTGGSGSGGFWELEDVLSWTFTSQAPIPGAPTNLRVASFASQAIDLAWNGNSFNETAFQVERSTDGTNFTAIGTTTGLTFEDTGLAPGTYFYRVKALDAAGSSPFSNVLSFSLVNNLPGEILTQHQDIGTSGNPSVAGNATFSNGVYTVTGSGSDIWDTADHMQYLYAPLTGDGQIVARILTETSGVNDFAKAGVMFRDSLDAGASNAYMMQFPNPGSRAGWPTYQWRAADGGSTADHEFQTTTAMPLWVRLVRSGNTFTGSWAMDVNGMPGTWNQLGAETAIMGSTAYVGLAVTSHQNGATVTATFDHVQIIPAVELTSHLDVSAPAFFISPGSPVSITVKALDQFNNVVPGYLGTVHFTSSDMMAGLPADYTFTAADAGVHTFTVTLQNLGRQTVTVTDTATNAIQGGTALTVTNGAILSSLLVTGFPSPDVVGAPHTFTVTARDAMGATLTGYLGTVHFTSTDTAAGLPADYTFTAADAGVHMFSATLNTAGTQSITVTDSAFGVSGSQSNIQVVAPPSITTIGRSATVINLGGTLTVSGTFADPTPGQTHQLVVSWGDNTANTTLTLAAGVFTFSTGHAYTQLGNFGIQVTVTGAAGLNDVDALPATAASVVPPANLVDWWTGDGTNPTTAPDIAGTNPGTLSGGVTYAPGEVGNAFSFDGNSNRGSYVNIPNAPSLNSTTGTWDFWLKTTQTSGFVGLVGKSDASGSVNGITMQMDQGHARVEVKGNGPTTLLTGTTTLNDGQWHHMALTFQSGGPVILYIDGRVEVSDTTTQTVFSFNATPLRFGTMTDGFWTPYNGMLDEVQIFNRMLSSSEIQSIYNGGAAGQLKGVRVQGAPAITNLSRSAAAINEGGTIAVSGAFTDPIAGQTHQLIVSWGDGSANTTLSLAAGVFTFSTNHQYLEEGNFAIRVTVQSPNGGSDTVTLPVTPAGLVSWWAGEGNAADVADNNPGTLNGNVTFAPGKTGKAFSFDGSSSSFVNVPDATNLDSTTGTWSFWLKTTQTSGFVGLVGKNDGPGGSVNGITMQMDQGFARVEVKSANQTLLLNPTAVHLNDGQWHQMTLTFVSGGQVVLYIDGQPAATGTAPAFTFGANDPLRFGVQTDGFWTPYNGLLDDVQVYNRALSAAEVQAIYSPVAVAPPANLVDWWTGDGNNPTTAPDIAGTNPGTLNGGVAYVPGEVGNAFSFNGASDRSSYVNIPDAPSLNSTTGTWDFWVNTTQSGSFVGFVGKADAAVSLNGLIMQMDPSGLPRLEIKNNSQTTLLLGTTPLNNGQWHNFALSFVSGGAMVMYVDGQVQATGTAPTFTFNPNPMRFGTQLDTFWAPYNGLLDEVQIYNRILSAGEIQAIFNADGAGLEKGVHVSDVAVVPVGGFTVTAAAGATTAPQTVAVFSDPAGAEALGDYSATINWGDVAVNSAGTISFDPATGLFTVKGSHAYAQVGHYTVTVTIHHDTAPDAMATSSADVFTPVFRVSGFPTSTVAGTPGTFTVTVQDPFGGTLSGYTGAVHFTSSDPQAVLPADYTFTTADAGMHMFSATLKTAGTQSLTATDTANSSITGTQSGIVVNPAAASRFVVNTSASTVTAGGSTTVTVTAYDAYGNVATGYGGTVHFTSTDPHAVLPADATLTNGTGTFTVTVKTAGSQTITATDTVNSALTATAAVTVTPAAASYLVVAGFPSPALRMQAYNFTVTAYDVYGNVATGYTGTVTFSSDESHADLPSDYTFTAADAGVHTFSATFNRFGTFYLRVRDTANPSITGEQDGIVVE
jgi:hypothetical protein